MELPHRPPASPAESVGGWAAPPRPPPRMVGRVRSLAAGLLSGPAEAKALDAAQAAEGALYHLYGLSVALQRDLGPMFADLGENRLAAGRALRAFSTDADRAAEPREVGRALSRVVRLVQDHPFCFTATRVAATRRPREEPRHAPAAVAVAWARDYTTAYPDLPGPLALLETVADETLLDGFLAGGRPLKGLLGAMRRRLGDGQRAAWAVRRAMAPERRA